MLCDKTKHINHNEEQFGIWAGRSSMSLNENLLSCRLIILCSRSLSVLHVLGHQKILLSSTKSHP